MERPRVQIRAADKSTSAMECFFRVRRKETEMGGRGASLGEYFWRGTHHVYGDEYHEIFTSGNIKFIAMNNKDASITAPQETMTRGRGYVTVDEKKDMPAYITYYDNDLKKYKSIDLLTPHSGVLPYVHHGLDHRKNDQPKGYTNLTKEEKIMVERVNKLWQDYLTRR